MGTKYWHPEGNEMPDPRSIENRDSLVQMVEEIRRDTGEIKVALFGLPEQPYMGFIPRVENTLLDHGIRLTGLEKRVWAWIGVVFIVFPILAWTAAKLMEHLTTRP